MSATILMHYWCWPFSSSGIAGSLSVENRKGILSLLCPLEAGQSGILLQNVTSLQRWKAWVTAGRPPGLFPRGPSSAPFHGWLRTGKRAPLGVRTEPAVMQRGIFLRWANTQRRHRASGALSIAAVKGESAFGGGIDLAWWLAAAGTKGASSPLLRASGRFGGLGQWEKRVLDVCKCRARWAQPAARNDAESGCCQDAQNNAFTCTFGEQTLISTQI